MAVSAAALHAGSGSARRIIHRCLVLADTEQHGVNAVFDARPDCEILMPLISGAS
jgi:hypothetical protein